ncbi:MAG: caspase family protein [Lewinellaceae bacterium]|nr:caspase family protein [Lewinellaceae bacterium]
MQQKPRLYALLAGIGQYRPPVPPLAGCTDDVGQIAAYLQESTSDFQLSLQLLKDEAATKAGIVQGFQSFLGQAGPGDTALFYYSGHGTQEEAGPGLWRFETDGKLEALVCYDSILEVEGGATYNLLADKELRYLIHQLSRKGANIVTIFDCCHAGDNTRNDHVALLQQGIRQRRYHPPRLSKACPARPWEQFLFAEAISPEQLKTRPLPEVLPIGPHIQLAACRSNQSAYEKDGSGAFTKGLLQLLRATDSRITYYDLAYRLRFQLGPVFGQSPQFYAAGQSDGALFQGFLGRAVSGGSLNGNVTYDGSLGWILDLGAMHGLNESVQEIRVQAVGSGTEARARIGAIHPNYAILHFSPEMAGQLEAGEVYKAEMQGSGLLSQKLNIALDGPPEVLAPLKAALNKEQAFGLVAAGTAGYVVRADSGCFLITSPGAPAQPLTRPIPWNDTGKVAAYLRHIARWSFIRSLYNPDSYLFHEHPVAMDFFRIRPEGAMEPLALEGDELITEYEWKNGEWSGRLRLRLTNRYDRPLYVSLLFLSLNFQVYPQMLGDTVILLEPGQEAWAFEGDDIELDFPKQVEAFRIPFSPAYFKLIISTEEFDASRFEQPALPAPEAQSDKETRSNTPTPTFQFAGDDWATRLVTLLVRNPLLGA